MQTHQLNLIGSSSKADILLTSEEALSGYTHDIDPEEVAAELHEATSLECEQYVLIYNQLRFYSTDGRYLGFHSKILHCSSLIDSTEGEICQ